MASRQFGNITPTSKRTLSSSLLDAPKKQKTTLRLSDIYRLSLATEKTGAQIKVSVSVGKDATGEVKYVATHLRRYKNGFATKEGIVLKSKDLEMVICQEAPACETFTDHSLSVTLEADSIVKLEVVAKYKTTSIEMDYTIWKIFRLVAPALRFIVAAICKTQKRDIVKEVLLSIIDGAMSTMNVWEPRYIGTVKQDLDHMKPVIQKDILNVEETLGISHDLTESVFSDPKFHEEVFEFLQLHHEERLEKDEMTKIILKNELSSSKAKVCKFEI